MNKIECCASGDDLTPRDCLRCVEIRNVGKFIDLCKKYNLDYRRIIIASKR